MATRLHVIYAGRGDAMVIEENLGGDPRVWVLDGGPAGIVHDARTGAPFPAYLRSTVGRVLGSGTSIPVVVVSHAHEDHFGGLIPLLTDADAYSVAGPVITQPLTEKDLERQGGQDLKERLLAKMGFGDQVAKPDLDQAPYTSFAWSDVNAWQQGSAPVAPQIVWTIDKDPDNAASVLMHHTATRMLFTGDSPGWRIADFLAAGDFTQLSIFKVPHHGSLRNVQRTEMEATVPKAKWRECGLLCLLADSGGSELPGFVMPDSLRAVGPRAAAAKLLRLAAASAGLSMRDISDALEQSFSTTLSCIREAGAGQVNWPPAPEFVNLIWPDLVDRLKFRAAATYKADKELGTRDKRYVNVKPSRPIPPMWATSFLNTGELSSIYLRHVCVAHISDFFSSFAATSYVISADGSHGHPAAETIAGIAAAAVAANRKVRVFVTDAESVKLYVIGKLAPSEWRDFVQVRGLAQGHVITLDPERDDPDTGRTTMLVEQVIDPGALRAQLSRGLAPNADFRPFSLFRVVAAGAEDLYLNIDAQGNISLSETGQSFFIEESMNLDGATSFKEVGLYDADGRRFLYALADLRPDGTWTLKVEADRWISTDESSNWLTDDSASASLARFRFLKQSAPVAVRLGKSPPQAGTLAAFCADAGIPADPPPSFRTLLPALAGPDNARSVLAQIRNPTLVRAMGWAADLSRSAISYTRDDQGLLVTTADIQLEIGSPGTFIFDGDTGTIADVRVTIARAATLTVTPLVQARSGIRVTYQATVQQPTRSGTVTGYVTALGLDPATLTLGSLLVNILAGQLTAGDLLLGAPSFLLSAGLAGWPVDPAVGWVRTEATVSGPIGLREGRFAATIPPVPPPVTVAGIDLTITALCLVVRDALLPVMDVTLEVTVRIGSAELTARTSLTEGDGTVDLRLPGNVRLADIAALLPGGAGARAELADVQVPVAAGTLSGLSLSDAGIVLRQLTAGGDAVELAEIYGTFSFSDWSAILPSSWAPTASQLAVRVLAPLDAGERSVTLDARLTIPAGSGKRLGVRARSWPAASGALPDGKTVSLWSDPDGALVTAADVLSVIPVIGTAATGIPVLGGLLDALGIGEITLSRAGALGGDAAWDDVVLRLAMAQPWTPLAGVTLNSASVDLACEDGAWSGTVRGDVTLGDYLLLEGTLVLPTPVAVGKISLTTADPSLTVAALAGQFGIAGLAGVPLIGPLVSAVLSEVTLGLNAGSTMALGAVGFRLTADQAALAASLPGWLTMDAISVAVQYDLGTSTTSVAVEANWGPRIVTLEYDGSAARLRGRFRDVGPETLAGLLKTLQLPLGSALTSAIGALRPSEGAFELALGTPGPSLTAFMIVLRGDLSPANTTARIGALEFQYGSPDSPQPGYRLRGRFRGAGTEAEVTMDLGADGNASTLRASVTSAGDRGLTLRGLLSLLGITDPPIAAPDGVACDPLLDVVIDAVDASFDVSGGSLALVEFTATVRSTGTYQLIGVPAVRLTGIGASVHWTPTSVSGVMIGQLAVGPVLVTVAYDGDVFAGWAEAGASGRPDFAALLASPPFDPGFGLPGGAPASIPLDRVEATARPGDFLEIRGGGDVAWAFTVAGLETTVTGLGGRIRIEAGRAGRAATYDCALLGTLALASVNGSAVAVFGSDRDTVLTAAVTAGEGVSFSALAGSLTGGDPDSSWNALVPPGDGTAALGRASQAFVYLNLTKGRIAVAGKLERFGHAALISFEPDAGRGYAFVGGLGDGFQFVNLWSALGAVDEVLAVRKADACVMSLTATAGSIEADLALVRDAAAVQHITSFSIALPPTVDPQAPLPRGMSLLAVLDLTAGTLTRNVGTLVGDATIVLSALVDHDDPARTFYTMRIEQADLVGGGLTLDGTATYRPGGEDPRLEVDGALTLNLGSKHYAFGGTFTIAADRAEFSAGPGRPVSIGEPLGMSGITLTDAQLTARYGFGRDASPAVVQVTGVVNLDPLELTGLVLFAGGAAQVVSIGLTGQLSIATFMTSVLHLPWPAGFDPVQLENGTISYADAAPGSFVRAGNVEYPGGYHITAMVSLLGATLGVDVLVDPAVGVRVSGSCQGTVDLYLAQIADPVLRIDTTQPATVYAAEFGITMFGTPFARITLAFEPHEDPGQRRYVGTATYPGMLLGTENPAVKLSYTKAGGLRLEEWPVLADVTQYLDLARELYQATSSDDPCGALVDLVFSQALTTKVSLGLKQDTSAATSESLPVVVTGTWAVLAGEEQLFELKLPDLHGVILVPAGLSADDLLTWIGGMIKANGAEIVKTVLGDPAMLTLLAKELVVDDLSSDVVKALLCHGADTIPLLDRALRDALRPPQPPPDQPPKPPPGGPTPIGDIAMDAAVAGTIASGLMAVILAIGSLFSAEARRRKKEAEGERGRQLKIKAEKEAQLRAALKLRGHPTLAFQGDGSLVVTWTEDNRPAEPGFDYQGYRGVGYEVGVTDEAGGTHAFTAEGWSVTVPAATLAQSPVATVTMRAWFAGQAGEFTSPVSARHVATLPAPASVTGTYNPATDAIDVTVAAVTHANSYLIEVWADREILATASPAQGPGDATAAFAVTDLPAGLPGDTTLQARARAVGDGTTWADSPVTAAAQALPVESGPVPSIALNEAGDEAVVAWSGRQPSQVAPIRFLDGDGTVISLPVSPGQAGMVADLSGLADGTVVNVELRAPAGHVIAPWSAPASVVVHRLATPRELDALYQTPEAQIVLTWQPVGGAAGYDAELTDGDGAPVPATITIDRSQPGATISGPAIVTGPAYGVRVRAAGGFASLWTGVHPVTAEAVPAVTQVTVEVAQGTVTATWAADGATRFLVTLSQGQAQLTRQWADSPEASWRLDAGLHLEGDRPFAVTVRPRVRQALGPPASGQGSFAGLLTLVQGLRAAGRSAADAAGVAVTAFPAIGPVQLLTALAAAGYPAGESRAATAASLPDVPPATLNETVAALQAPKPLYDLVIREVDPASIKPLFEVLFAGPLVLMAVAYKKAGLTGPQALPLLGGPVAQVVVTAVYDDPEQLGAALRTGQVAAQAAVAAFRDAYPDLGLGPIVASLQGGWYSVLDPLLGRALMACYPVGTAAYADVIAPGLSPAQLVQALVAVAEPYQALDQLLRVRSGITLAAAGEALASGLDNAGAKVPALSLQQIFGRGVSEALSRDPGGVNPPPPGTTGGPAGWSRPLFDPAPQAPVLALCAAPGGEPVLVANTGAYLTFLDAATSEIRAVVEGDTWDMRVAARGDVVYACDVLAGQFHALRADGSLAWQQPFAGGQWVVAETVVVFQDTATGALAAFDRLTGAPRWAASPGVAVPNLGMAAAEGMIFFKTGAGKGNAGLQAWDERTGTLIWSRSDLGHGDGLWIPLTGLDVVDYDLVCTVAPYVWFLDPATGQRLRSGQPFVDWSQRPGRYSWAATPFPYLAFMGALGGVGWLMSPATASIPTRAFPSLGTARNGRPDYNDWKVPVPFTIGAHFYLSLPGPDLVRVIQIAPPSDPLEVHGTEIRTLTGAATDIVVDSGTYYATMIQPGRRGLDGVWLVCLPIDVSAPPPPPPAVGTAILVRRDFSDCGNSDVTAARGAEHGGTVTVLRQPSSFSATVTLDHGTPDTSYHFFLKCVAYLGNVVTDASGRGTATFEFASSLVGSRIAFDMYPPGAPRGNKFLSTPLTI